MTTEIQNKVLDHVVHGLGGGGGAGKNKVIGGDFATNGWPEGTSFAAVSNLVRTANLFQYIKTGSSAVHTVSKVAGVADGSFSLRIETTSTDVGAAGEFTGITHAIEGFNIVPLIGGGAYVSGIIRSDVTGIICWSLQNSGKDRSFVKEIDILVADTFQLVGFEVPALPSGAGTWNFTTGVGLHCTFVMDAGSTYQTTADAWQTGNFLATANQVNRNANIGNYVEVDKIQIEEGAAGSSFEPLLIGSVIDLQERYFEEPQIANIHITSSTNSSGFPSVHIHYKEKRVQPTLSSPTNWDYERSDSSGNAAVSLGTRSTTHVRAFLNTGGAYVGVQIVPKALTVDARLTY